jgi:RNA polymerase sigma factor (sigma-70 family)
MERSSGTVAVLQTDSDGERDRLVRLCYRLTGDPEAAEDLAQETFVRAWQHAHQLREPARRDAWLAAIARNASRGWLRDRQRSPVHLPTAGVQSWSEALGEAEPADDFDVEIELERHELAGLLDRAMAALSPETRQVLVERFVAESPQAETARRLGLSEGAVAMRLQRGKLALRRILVTAYPQVAADHGLRLTRADDHWRTTRIWCPMCGRQRLRGILIQRLGVFRLHCPDCGPLNNSQSLGLFVGATGYRGALNNLLGWAHWLYRHSLVYRTVPCPGCGRDLIIRTETADRGPIAVPNARRLISYYCARCRGGTWNGQDFNVLALPEARRFWRAHPRMRALPEREVDAGGRPAVVAGFASLTDRARIEVVYARDTLHLLAVHGDGVGPR